MRLYRAFATVGGVTMLSRILGFVRDIMIASALGAGLVADAFFAAFQIPNLFRRLFAEGAFNSAFVPLFAKRLETEGRASAREFAERVMAALLALLLTLTVLAEIAMPWLVPLFAPGFLDNPEKFDLTVLMTRICFPYLACMSLVALLSGILNTEGRFAVATAVQVLLNVVLIIVMGIVFYAGLGNRPEAGIVLAWGVAVAGLLQLLWLAIAVYRMDMGLGFRLPRLSADVRELVKLGTPGLIAGGVTQLNLWIGGVIATFEPGARSFLYYADRLYQLPLGIVGVAIGVVLLPDLSRKLRAGDHGAVIDSQNRSIEFALFLTLPSAFALIVMAEPIISVLFERGAFTTADSKATAYALAAYALGLPAFVMQKVFQPAFFAREDTKTPMRFAIVNMVLNVLGSAGLFYAFKAAGWMPHVGIAIATTVAGWVNALMLWTALLRRGHFISDRHLARRAPLILIASLVMGVCVYFATTLLMPYLMGRHSFLVRAGALACVITAGAVVFLLLIEVTGAMRLRSILSRAASRAHRA